MTKHRPHRYTKPDKNQKEIVKDLEKLGFDVDVVSSLPGIYDLVVSGKKTEIRYFGTGGRCTEVVATCSVRVEVKNERGKLNENEEKYHEKQKHKGSLIVARSTSEILDWFGK